MQKFLAGDLRKFFRKANHERFGQSQALEKLKPMGQGHQNRTSFAGFQNTARVRIKSNHHGRHCAPTRLAQNAFQYSLMTAVNPVKNAYRHRARLPLNPAVTQPVIHLHQ
jgi:hypothetical protein